MSGPTVEGRPSLGSVVHGTIDPRNFSLGLVASSQSSLQNRKIFQHRHLAYVLEKVGECLYNTRLKPLQIETVDTPIPDCRDDGALHGLLLTWFDIFDSAFFGGGLRDLRDRIYLEHHGKDGIKLSATSRAYAYFDIEDLGKIVIDAEHELLFGARREEKIIASLLHEMLHAFIGFYSCRCHQCDAMIPASLGGIGQTEHGPAWIGPMLAIGRALQDRVNWQVDVSINVSIANEMNSSNWEPTIEEVTRWGLSLPLLRSNMRSLQQYAARLAEEDRKEREQYEARLAEENRKEREQSTLRRFDLPANYMQNQDEQEVARQMAQGIQKENQKAKLEREQKAKEEERKKQEKEALDRQMAYAQREQEQKEQKQRDEEQARREREQSALRQFGLPADYLQIQDEQEVARLMAEGIQNQNQNQNQKAKVTRRQTSQDADPKKDEVVSLKDRVLRKFGSAVTKRKRK